MACAPNLAVCTLALMCMPPSVQAGESAVTPPVCIVAHVILMHAVIHTLCLFKQVDASGARLEVVCPWSETEATIANPSQV